MALCFGFRAALLALMVDNATAETRVPKTPDHRRHFLDLRCYTLERAHRQGVLWSQKSPEELSRTAQLNL
jgi:hypothetical protein